MVRRSAMVELQPRGQLVEQLCVRARIDLALQDLRRAADRERRHLAAQLLARLLRVERHLGARALDEPRALRLRRLLRALDDLIAARLRLLLDRQCARAGLPHQLFDAALGRRARSFWPRSAAARPSAILRVRSWMAPGI